jgi:hypothetical protein
MSSIIFHVTIFYQLWSVNVDVFSALCLPGSSIKPKDSTQSSTITKSDLMKQVNPLDSQLHIDISKVKDLRGGGVLENFP